MKNEMPIGRRMSRSAAPASDGKSAAAVSSRNEAYLNTPSMHKSSATASTSSSFLRRGNRAMSRPITQLTRMAPIISST